MSNLSKTFFHPVLSHESRDFVDGSLFEVSLSPRINENGKSENLSIDYSVKLTSPAIQELLSDGSAGVFLDLYSKETISRVLAPLDGNGGTVEFASGQLLGMLEVQPYVIATKQLMGYKPAGINSEYGAITFNVGAGSHLAIAEKILIPLTFKRVSLESIIRVQQSDDIDTDSYLVNLESSIITILMGKSFHALWDIMRSDPAVRPYLFLSVYKDTFVEALGLINKSEDVEEYAWAQTLITKCEQSGIKIDELTDFASQNQAVLRLLREFGVHKLLASEA